MSGVTERERETLCALEAALDSDVDGAIESAAKVALDAAPMSVVHGEVGAVFKAIGRHARRHRIRGEARELDTLRLRVRELEGHVAQLQEQRGEALVQRDDRQACSDLLARLTLAVGYLLDRAQKDAKLGYHLGPHVEAWERLVALEAEVLERDPAAHRSARAKAL